MTSNPYGIPLVDADFATGGLRVASFARSGKLFTAHPALMIRSVGTLNDTAFQRVRDAVVALLRPTTTT